MLISKANYFQIEEKQQLAAWMVSYIISYTGKLKKPVKPEQLIGRKKPKRVINKQEEWAILKREFGEVT